MHPSKESGGDGLLTVWRRVDIVKGFQQGADGGQEDGAVRLVNGTWQETVPERRSQVACGLSDSRHSHCLATMAGRSTVFVPGGGSVAREEGSGGKLALFGRVLCEVGVEPGSCAESSPPAEYPVLLLMGSFLAGVQDDCAIATT